MLLEPEQNCGRRPAALTCPTGGLTGSEQPWPAGSAGDRHTRVGCGDRTRRGHRVISGSGAPTENPREGIEDTPSGKRLQNAQQGRVRQRGPRLGVKFPR